MSASARLRAKLDVVLPMMRLQAAQLWAGPETTGVYPQYLMTMHTIVRSAVPLMESALHRARSLAAQGDAVADGLADYLRHHVEEERGHDQWLLEDLAVAGGDPTEPLRRIPSPRVAELVGAQYYWLRHHHPISLLGHMAAIEGYPPPVGFARHLEGRTGLPSTAFRAIAIHERLDIRHSHELFATIDALPLRPEHEAMVGISALHTVGAAVDVLAQIRRDLDDRDEPPDEEPPRPDSERTHHGGARRR